MPRYISNRGGRNFSATNIKCMIDEIEFGSHSHTKSKTTVWKSIKPIPNDPECRGDVHGIHIAANPLDDLKRVCEDDAAKSTMNYLFLLAERWLDRDASDPIDVDSSFRKNMQESDDLTIKSLASLILIHVEKVCEEHVKYMVEKDIRSGLSPFPEYLLRWVPWTANDSFDGTGVYLDIASKGRLSAFVRLMRNPGPYDGGNDYIFERFMRVVISLFFESEDLHWIGESKLWYEDVVEGSRFPLIIVGEHAEFNREAQTEMALAAERILRELTIFEATDGQIKHKIVYGLHCDLTKLRIIAHFMNHPGTDSRSHWNFCQVVVAQHLVTMNPDGASSYCHMEDDTFVDRWHIACALFTIRREVERLKNIMGGYLHDCSEFPKIQLGVIPHRPLVLVTKEAILIPNLSSDYLETLRRYWRDDSGFGIPEEWMPDQRMPICLHPGIIEMDKQVTRELLPKLVKVLLEWVKPFLRPLSKVQMKSNSEDPNYCGPDFLHPINVPRSLFAWPILGVSRKTTTEPHLTKLWDILSLSVTRNRDINLYIANTFASLSGYNVNWYPAEFEEPDNPEISVDFVLVPDNDDEPSDKSISESSEPSEPPESPVPLFFGLYLRTRDVRNWMQHEDVINIILNRYIQRLCMQGGEQILFCSLLAGTCVHILGLERAQGNANLHHVDSITITPCFPNTDAEVVERLRLTMALFTLKRHVYKLAKQCGGDMGGTAPKERIILED